MRPPAAGHDHAGVHGERVAREDHVRAAAGPDARHLLLAVELVGADAVRPHARGVDHVRGRHLELAAAGHVADQHARRPPVALHEAGDLAAVGHHRAEALRLPEHGQHQAHVVGLAVVEEVRGRGVAPRERREHPHRLGTVDGAVTRGAPVGVLVAPAAPAHRVVHVEPHAQQPVGALAPEAGDEERQRPDQVRGQLHELRALEQRLAHEAEVEVLQVAQAAVDQLRRAARRARREVAPLDERHAVPARGGVEGHAGTGDPPADHDQVVGVALQGRQGVRARDHGRNVTNSPGARRSGGSFSCRGVPRWINPSTRSPSSMPTAARPSAERSTAGVRQ